MEGRVLVGRVTALIKALEGVGLFSSALPPYESTALKMPSWKQRLGPSPDMEP
jgi:hypothetical protein